MKLGAFLMAPGHHVAAWRHPSAIADLGVNFPAYARIARAAEAAGFDLLFLDDNVAVVDGSRQTGPRSSRSAFFEPITLLSALAAVTDSIGLAGTASTTFNEPYNIARKFASLDLISEGRAAWNVVTSRTDVEARNFNAIQHMEHAERYARAEEFVELVVALWNSYEDDAFLYDTETGLYFDPDKQHAPHHAGRFFSVDGPLNIARSPQGRPVIIQAGASGPGIALAARTAEVVFTAQHTLEEARDFYRKVKNAAAAQGRASDHVQIMPGIFPVVAQSRSQAQEQFEQLQSLIHSDVAIRVLSDILGGFDLSGYSPDAPVPELPETNGGKSRQALLLEMARSEHLSILELARRVAGARGHWQVVGTAADVADQMESWFLGEAADGFNVMPPTLPGGLDDFIRLVMPELGRRGLLAAAQPGRTLRQRLGLPAR